MPASSHILTAVFVATISLAAVWDLRESRIPNWLTVPALIAAPLLRGGLVSGEAALDGVAGGTVGLLVGLLAFGTGVMGGGDAKLLAVVGAFLGPLRLGGALLAVGVAGGILALIVELRRGRLAPVAIRTWELGLWMVTLGRRGRVRTLHSEEGFSLPYGVAIAAGAAFVWFLPQG